MYDTLYNGVFIVICKNLDFTSFDRNAFWLLETFKMKQAIIDICTCNQNLERGELLPAFLHTSYDKANNY